MSLDDFDKTVGSPKQKNPMPKRSISESPKSSEALKKFKSNAEPPVATMVTLADIKRQKIQECNIALKVNCPVKDPGSVIFYAIQYLGRQMYMSPTPPFCLYKVILTLFPEWNDLNVDERINQLLDKLSTYVCKNIEWTKVLK